MFQLMFLLLFSPSVPHPVTLSVFLMEILCSLPLLISSGVQELNDDLHLMM